MTDEVGNLGILNLRTKLTLFSVTHLLFLFDSKLSINVVEQSGVKICNAILRKFERGVISA